MTAHDSTQPEPGENAVTSAATDRPRNKKKILAVCVAAVVALGLFAAGAGLSLLWDSSETSAASSDPSFLKRSEFREQIRNAKLPKYAYEVSPVTAQRLDSSWRPGCPVPVEHLRLVSVRYVGMDKRSHDGQLVVNAEVADEIGKIFGSLYEMRFPMTVVSTVENYGSNDTTSMRANNTSGFNCRNIAGTNRWSKHSYGAAIDINPLVNPYVVDGKADPAEAEKYRDRKLDYAGMLVGPDDPAVHAFTDHGWTWGGSWTDPVDLQHFEKKVSSPPS